MVQPANIKRRRIPSDDVRERAKFVREWMRGYEAKDGIDLRRKLSKSERQRVHRAYNKLRAITPGADSQQKFVVKEVRSERTSRLYQEYAQLPTKLKNLKRVPITATGAFFRDMRALGEPEFEIDYKARKGKGEVRVRIGKARVRSIEFDKIKLLQGDAAYLDWIAAQVPDGSLATLVMGGREQTMMPWATDGGYLVDNILEVLSKYAPSDSEIQAILDDEMDPEDAEDFDPDVRAGSYSRNARQSPWTQWLEGARIYYMTEGEKRAHVAKKASAKKKPAKKKPRKKKRKLHR